MTLQSINHNRNYYEKGRNLEKFNSFGLFYYLYKVVPGSTAHNSYWI